MLIKRGPWLWFGLRSFYVLFLCPSWKGISIPKSSLYGRLQECKIHFITLLCLIYNILFAKTKPEDNSKGNEHEILARVMTHYWEENILERSNSTRVVDTDIFTIFKVRYRETIGCTKVTVLKSGMVETQDSLIPETVILTTALYCLRICCILGYLIYLWHSLYIYH